MLPFIYVYIPCKQEGRTMTIRRCIIWYIGIIGIVCIPACRDPIMHGNGSDPGGEAGMPSAGSSGDSSDTGTHSGKGGAKNAHGGETHSSGGSTSRGGASSTGGTSNDKGGAPHGGSETTGGISEGGTQNEKGGSEAEAGTTSISSSGGASFGGTDSAGTAGETISEEGGTSSGGSDGESGTTASLGGIDGTGGETISSGGSAIENGGTTSAGGRTFALGGYTSRGGASYESGGTTVLGIGGIPSDGGTSFGSGGLQSFGGSGTGGVIDSNGGNGFGGSSTSYGGSGTGGNTTSVGGSNVGGSCGGDKWIVDTVGREIRFSYGSGVDYPQYAALYTDSSHLRLTYGHEGGWGTAVLLTPSFWIGPVYYMGTPIETEVQLTCDTVTVEYSGTIAGLHSSGTLVINAPTATETTAHVHIATSGTITLANDRPREAFKPVMLTSMHDSSTFWDASSIIIGNDSYAFPATIENQWMTSTSIPATRFGLVGGTSTWVTNGPTIIVETTGLINPTVTGWITHFKEVDGVLVPVDEDDDNVGLWTTETSVPGSWSYNIIAKGVESSTSTRWLEATPRESPPRAPNYVESQ